MYRSTGHRHLLSASEDQAAPVGSLPSCSLTRRHTRQAAVAHAAHPSHSFAAERQGHCSSEVGVKGANGMLNLAQTALLKLS